MKTTDADEKMVMVPAAFYEAYVVGRGGTELVLHEHSLLSQV